MISSSEKRVTSSRLTQSETEVLATELLAAGVSKSAQTLFSILNSTSSSEIAANVLDLFRELATREPKWVPVLQKSTKKSGRCPKKLRRTLKELLKSDQSRFARSSDFADLLASEIFTEFETIVEREETLLGSSGPSVQYSTRRSLFGRTDVRVKIFTELTDIRRMETLAKLLSELGDEIDTVTLDFDGVEHVYVVGLAGIKAWLARVGARLEVENASDSTHAYLDHVGFLGNTPRAHRSHPQNFYTIAIEPILGAQPESLASRLVEVIDRHMPISKNTRSGLLVALAELVENVHRHGGKTSSAFACAQVYPRNNKLTVCIVDTGVGVRQSFHSGENVIAKERLKNGESALKLATSPLVTSKPGKHSGYGLYVVSELAVRNGGTFRIFSENEILTLFRKGWTRREHHAVVSPGWAGTWIAVLFDLNSLLPIGDVYSTLPPSEGTEVEDYF